MSLHIIEDIMWLLSCGGVTLLTRRSEYYAIMTKEEIVKIYAERYTYQRIFPGFYPDDKHTMHMKPINIHHASADDDRRPMAFGRI
jgi:hypothetical protein